MRHYFYLDLNLTKMNYIEYICNQCNGTTTIGYGCPPICFYSMADVESAKKLIETDGLYKFGFREKQLEIYLIDSFEEFEHASFCNFFRAMIENDCVVIRTSQNPSMKNEHDIISVEFC